MNSKVKQKLTLMLLIISLAVHLVYSNADLINGILKASNIESLNYSQYVFAASYSLLTITIMALYPKIWLICLVACLDGFGIYLKYNIYQTHFVEIGSVYFGVYTALIVIAAGLISINQMPKKRRVK
jgi:uncharacterized membrane protein YjjP (DUF1212 family)